MKLMHLIGLLMVVKHMSGIKLYLYWVISTSMKIKKKGKEENIRGKIKNLIIEEIKSLEVILGD